MDPQEFSGGNEQAVADWVYKNNKRAGATTDTFSAASCLYHAVREAIAYLQWQPSPWIRKTRWRFLRKV